MKLETAIEQLIEIVYGKNKHDDIVKLISETMTKISGHTTVPGAKFKELLKLSKKLKSMGMK